MLLYGDGIHTAGAIGGTYPLELWLALPPLLFWLLPIRFLYLKMPCSALVIVYVFRSSKGVRSLSEDCPGVGFKLYKQS